MAETGIVTGVTDSMLEVQMKRHDACAHCGACISFSGDNIMHLMAKNCCKASIGDTVEITLESSRFLSAVLFLYGIPLLAFLLSLLICYLLGVSELITMLLSLMVLGFTWLGIHQIAKHLNRNRYLPRAIRVITEASDNN